MKKFSSSLRVKLFLWYVSSLAALVIYFLLFIHYYNIEYGMYILTALFILLAAAQLFIIYKITDSITRLSSKIKIISSENLEERIEDIRGEDEIGELAQSFNNLLDRLNDAFTRERQFIGDVAHELKTPLATLRSSFEVTLSKNRSNQEYKQVIEEAITEADALSSTLKNVLDLAWIETPNQRQRKEIFNLTELVGDLFEIAQKLALKKKITISLLNTPNVSMVGFKDKFARALINIIENAIKYSSNHGKVGLILEKTPKKIIISVSDNGPGIPEADLPFIFERFYRGSETDKVFGSGLGLAIAKSIINLHDGEIKVKSSRGQGSAFMIVLPAI